VIPYEVIFLFVAGGAVLANFVRGNIFYYVNFFLLILFAGLRVNIGVDFESYDQMFDLIRIDAAPFDFEPLNMAIIYLINFIGIGNQFIFLMYSFIIMVGVHFFIQKFSPYEELSLLIFFAIGIYYFSTLNGLRQWAAISMFLMAVVKMAERKWVLSVVLMFAAILFHLSAVILLLSPLLIIRWRFVGVVVALVVCLLVSDLFLFFIQNSKYNLYLDILIFGKEGSSFLLSVYLVCLVVPFVFFRYFSRGVPLSGNTVLLLNMNLASVFVLLLGAFLKIDFLILMRLNSYFQVQLIVLIPMLVVGIKNGYLRFLCAFGCIVFCGVYYFYILCEKGVEYKLVPYEGYVM